MSANDLGQRSAAPRRLARPRRDSPSHPVGLTRDETGLGEVSDVDNGPVALRCRPVPEGQSHPASDAEFDAIGEVCRVASSLVAVPVTSSPLRSGSVLVVAGGARRLTMSAWSWGRALWLTLAKLRAIGAASGSLHRSGAAASDVVKRGV